jgi:hypothetical protein
LIKKWRTRKVDGSWFFDPEKWKNDKKGPYSDLWKNSPHKKHCAWARTPPWDFYRIYWNLWFFSVFGPSIQPEKASPKSASTANPPSECAKKWNFSKKGDFLIIRDPISTHGSGNLSRPNFNLYHFFKILYYTKLIRVKWH